jgi:N-acyl-D-aspartate/D-glutamate deacylase
MFDLLIKGGTVIDGTGSAPVTADVAIEGDRIAGVGLDLDGESLEVIDATDCVVTPGFIDIHSHSDMTLLRDPRAVSALHQGVTLEVVGNCGHGCFPIADASVAPVSMYGYDETVNIDWVDANGYFERLEAAAPAVNVISLVPHGQLRLSTVGAHERQATDTELGSMLTALEESLEQGAWGLSTGLEYAAERAATETEIAGLCRAVARRDALYATHTRERDQGAPQAVEEAVRVALHAGVRLQVSHLVPRSGTEEATACIEVVDRARGAIDLAFDMHTRLYGISYLKAALPAAALEGTPEEVAARLADPSSRAELREYRSMFSVADWATIVLLDHEAWPAYGRKSIAEIAADRSQGPMDAVFDLLAGAARSGETLTVLRMCHSENQQREAFSHPLCMPGSDAMTLAPDGPLAGVMFHGAYSWAAWYYRFAVRDAGLLRPEDAIFRLTGAPAARLGLSGRGVLRPGAYADVVVFDPERFAETATTFEPNQLAVGVHHVVVNGTPAVRAGQLTGLRAGAVLRRPGSGG